MLPFPSLLTVSLPSQLRHSREFGRRIISELSPTTEQENMSTHHHHSQSPPTITTQWHSQSPPTITTQWHSQSPPTITTHHHHSVHSQSPPPPPPPLPHTTYSHVMHISHSLCCPQHTHLIVADCLYHMSSADGGGGKIMCTYGGWNVLHTHTHTRHTHHAGQCNSHHTVDKPHSPHS